MATGLNYLRQKLEQRFEKLREKRYRQLKFADGALVPTIFDLEAGAVEVVAEMMREVGSADFISGDAMDYPLVDVSLDEERYRIFSIGAAFSYSFDEARKAEKGNYNITDKRMGAAHRAIEERMNGIAAFGASSNAITGLLNNGLVTPVNSSFNMHLGATTSQHIADFWIDELRAMHDASNNVEFPTTALISSAQYFTMIKRRITDNDSTTIKDYVQKALSDDGWQFRFEKVDECSSARLEKAGLMAAGTNKDRILFYPKDPEVVERHVEETQLVPDEWCFNKDGKQFYMLFSCATPVIVNYPGALRYVDVPKA